MSSSLALLPLEEGKLNEAISSAITAMESQGFTADEARLKLESSFEEWLDKDGMAEALPPEIHPLLSEASWASRVTANPHTAYKNLVNKIAGKHSRTRRKAAILLSRLPQIILLAEEFNNSPARIARLLGPTDGHGRVSWKSVRVILTHFKISNDLDETLIAALLESDRALSAEEFGDADAAAIVDLIFRQGVTLGLDLEFSAALERLFPPIQGQAFIPYLQMLLFVSVIDHFYDHPSEYLYAFKPRGGVANLIFGSFPSELAPTGNPMLNNSKAVNRLSYDWAESRDDNKDQAEALVEVVLALSSLSYTARKQLSGSIRRGIFRFIEINTPAPVSLQDTATTEDVSKFLRAVAGSPTNTRGIIEQRVTDFLGVMKHQDTAWRPRGLGDPVNASNTSSRKLGDCDFQNAATQVCQAVEAHAGRLSDVYLHEHLRTLRLNLPRRLDEWSGISEIAEWKLEVLFVAHENALSQDRDQPELVIPCDIQVTTFAEACEEVIGMAETRQGVAVELFNRWIVQPLNAPNTPHSVKQKAIELFALS